MSKPAKQPFKCKKCERNLVTETSPVTEDGFTITIKKCECGYQTTSDYINEIMNPKRDVKLVDLICMVCEAEFKGEEPKMCCSGRDCGCMGLPTEPIVCSKQCYDNLPINKQKSQ